jgi:hypothetical protein
MTTDNSMTFLSHLLKNKDWPLKYMFKFIAPNNDGKVAEVVQLLPPSGTITYKHTPNLRYVAITCVADMPTAESIVHITSKATSIDGVMAL